MMKMLTRVRLTGPFRQSRLQIGLPSTEQSRLRKLLELNPLSGCLIYPIMSLRSKFKHAGVYEHVFEVRTCFGTPLQVITQSLFIHQTIPMFSFDLFDLTGSDNTERHLSTSVMNDIDMLASMLASIPTQPI